MPLNFCSAAIQSRRVPHLLLDWPQLLEVEPLRQVHADIICMVRLLDLPDLWNVLLMESAASLEPLLLLIQKSEDIFLRPLVCRELEDDLDVRPRIHDIVKTFPHYVEDLGFFESEDPGLVLPQDDSQIPC